MKVYAKGRGMPIGKREGKVLADPFVFGSQAQLCYNAEKEQG
jgi:hypothetical protein